MEIINPLTGKSSSYVKNSAHFVERISDAPIHSNQMVNLDVVSLFTKVPTDETLAVVRDKLAADSLLEERTCIPIDNLMEMLTFCVETTYFTTVCLPYAKGLAERIKKICSPYDIRTVFTSGSTLRRYLFRVKPPTEFNMTKNCVYSIPCSCGKIYKGETGRPLKVRIEEHRKAIVRGEIEKSGIADHIWKENGNHLLLWDKVEIIDRAEHWRIRRLKESAHMLGYNDLLSRLSIELNTIWEPIIKKAR